jgi:hypothetical protein
MSAARKEEEALVVEPPSSTRAMRTLASLESARNYRVLEGSARSPRRISIRPMDEESTWRWVSGGGKGAWYEKEGES